MTTEAKTLQYPCELPSGWRVVPRPSAGRYTLQEQAGDQTAACYWFIYSGSSDLFVQAVVGKDSVNFPLSGEAVLSHERFALLAQAIEWCRVQSHAHRRLDERHVAMGEPVEGTDMCTCAGFFIGPTHYSDKLDRVDVIEEQGVPA